jgi:two-component system, cell cycle sensor histidine kinase and response regulator CckA
MVHSKYKKKERPTAAEQEQFKKTAVNRTITPTEITGHLLTILNNMAEMVIYQDTKNHIIWASRAAMDSVNLTAEELKGRICYEVWHKRAEPCVDCPVLKAIETGQVQHTEMTSPDGKIWSVRGVPLKDKNGVITGAVETVLQVTEKKKIEQALTDELTRRRILIDQSSDGMVVLDQNGKVYESNQRFTEMLGYKPEEILKLHVWDWETIATREELMEMIRTVDETGMHLESVHRRKDGTTYNVDISSNAAVIAGQKLILCVCRDISVSKRIEQTLRETEVKLIEAHQLAHIGVWEWDAASDTVTWSEELYNIAGLNPKQPAPTYAEHPNIYTKESFTRLSEAVDESLKKGTDYQLELELVRPDGTIRWTYAFGGPKYDNNGKIIGLHGILQDITDKKRIEEEQQHIQKLESIGLLAGGIAHDFNNILTAILGNISLTRMDLQQGQKADNLLKEAERATLRARDLTQQLLTFSKGGEPVKKMTAITELVTETANFALRGSNIQCCFNIPDELWQVNVDKGQISQVISNLVINARQAMPSGGTIEITAKNILLDHSQTLGRRLPLKPGDYIRITVTDQGTGISEKHLNKIFDPYFSTKQTGSGLGLTTSYSIIHNHGGHISVESRVDVGSKFYIYLPAYREKAPKQTAKTTRPLFPNNLKVMIMDDEESVRLIAGRMLKAMGITLVEHAVNGGEAIDKFKLAREAGHPFDLVIMDLTIPGGMGGKETIKKLLKIDPEVKTIVSSGYTDESILARYREYGFKAMVAKPFTLEQLHDAIAAALQITD